MKFSLFVFLVLVFCIAADAQVSQSTNVRLVRTGEARITASRIAKEFAEKPLTGVVLEIDYEPGDVRTLDTSIVARSANGTTVSPVLIAFETLGQGSDPHPPVEFLVVKRVALVGGEATIGADTFRSNGTTHSELAITPGTSFGPGVLGLWMPFLLDVKTDGSLKCTFQTKGILRFALIYPAKLENSSSVLVFGKDLKLELRTGAHRRPDSLAGTGDSQAGTTSGPAPGRINLLAAENGGQVLVGSGDEALKLLSGQDARFYGPEQSKPGEGGNWGEWEQIFAFKDEQFATFDTVSVLIPNMAGENIKEFELLVNN